MTINGIRFHQDPCNSTSGEDFSGTTLHKISIHQPGTLPCMRRKWNYQLSSLKLVSFATLHTPWLILIAQLIINCYSLARDTAVHEEKIKLSTKFLTIGQLYHLARTLIDFNSTTLHKMLYISRGRCHARGENEITDKVPYNWLSLPSCMHPDWF